MDVYRASTELNWLGAETIAGTQPDTQRSLDITGLLSLKPGEQSVQFASQGISRTNAGLPVELPGLAVRARATASAAVRYLQNGRDR